jgi:tetratricopeptide (TPR) repeat protein
MNRYFLNTVIFVFFCLVAGFLRSGEENGGNVASTKSALSDTKDAKIHELCKKAKQAILQKDYDAAAKYLAQTLLYYDPKKGPAEILTISSVLAGVYHLQGKEELVLPIWEAVPFEIKIYQIDVYFDYGNLLHRSGKFKKSENFFSREIVLIENEIKEYKNKTNQKVTELDILHFNLGVCFYHRIISRLIQNKKLTPELKYMIQDDIKNCVSEIKQINSPSFVREQRGTISRNCSYLLDMMKADPQQRFLAPKKQQPPILTGGKTMDDVWDVYIVFEFEVADIDE